MLTRHAIRQVKLRGALLPVALLLLLLALCSVVSAQTSSLKKRSRNHRPRVTLSLSAPFAKLFCPGTAAYTPGEDHVLLLINATDPDGDNLQYTFTVTGGRIDSTGERIVWLLKDAKEGRHKATVKVSDGQGGLASASAYVETGCDMLYMCPNKNLISSAYDEVEEGQPLTFTLRITSGDTRVTPTYRWMLSAGKITSGQGTAVITVDTTGVVNDDLTATVQVGGYHQDCDREDSYRVKIKRKY
jgi:hypothetical protein